MGIEILTVTKEALQGGCLPCSYVIRLYEGWSADDDPRGEGKDKALAVYDTNTINLRAATEYIAMVARSHGVEAEDVHFCDNCHDLDLSWRSYNELR